MASEKRLLLLRHAKAEAGDVGIVDHDRALMPRGIQDARRMGRYFREQQFDPDLILCSTSTRTRQTERELRANSSLSVETIFLAELYLAPWEEIVKSIRGFATNEMQSLLVIGHNPGLEECAARLTGELVLLAPGAMALVGLEERDFDSIGDRGAKLRGVVSAKSMLIDGE